MNPTSPPTQHSAEGFLLSIGAETPRDSTSVADMLPLGSIHPGYISAMPDPPCPWRIPSARLHANRLNDPASTLGRADRFRSGDLKVSLWLSALPCFSSIREINASAIISGEYLPIFPSFPNSTLPSPLLVLHYG